MTARRGLGSIVVALCILASGSAPASGAEPPSLRLVAAGDEVVAHKSGKTAWIDPGVYVASVGGAFDLRLSRPAYSEPVDLYQFDPATDAVVRDLPEDVLAGWSGLADFLDISLVNAEGHMVAARTRGFCPNQGEHQRVDDEGPTVPSYPTVCGSHPFTRGMVWGIDRGWAVGALGWASSVRVRVPIGVYTMAMAIRDPYVTLFDIPSDDATVQVTVRILKGQSGTPAPREGRTGAAEQQSAGVPDDPSPSPDSLPDVVALPAWGMTIDERQSRELLLFAAIEWNAGPQPLVVEGFRQPGEDLMVAYQYFYADGQPVGRAPVGTMKFHAKPGHFHWHFTQFTAYSLLDSTRTKVVQSNKRSWCLAPTDPIDLLVPGAEWQPEHVGLHTACGYPSSLWVREVLPVGWGDTYVQYVAGQAFDITGLPNGTYFVKVHVNPLDKLHETDLTNNVALRKIRIRGKPGNRRVVVPPWQGIDTETYGY